MNDSIKELNGQLALDDGVVDVARHDLARQRGISFNMIALKKMEVVDWPDASLGCPEAGQAYAQVIVPGYRLVLSDGASGFEYHTDSHLKVVYCRRES